MQQATIDRVKRALRNKDLEMHLEGVARGHGSSEYHHAVQEVYRERKAREISCPKHLAN